ncbi:DUF2653 family protein [Alicyclobacillus dauci]|uniref:YxcD family protein n=1 Tax=Alicyclobacillus dauci TaxID=1475485 RepID=A0ABY6YZ78_9BACL|nr:DUF2653 family protein [Alicyclobacillus dauci]WAH35940.1 YxcD family protein [Alicyclobacillus dauci]
MFGRDDPSYRYLDEQAVADACCEYVADIRRCAPEDVDVELMYHPRDGFSAGIRINGYSEPPLSEKDLVDAVADFVSNRERVAPRQVTVNLQFDERAGIYADVSI